MTPSQFAAFCDPEYRPGLHHRMVGAIIADAIRRGGARLILNMPPQHGKSRLCAVETPLMAMARTPRTKVVVASYASSLATKHSAEARLRIDSDQWKALAPGVRIAPGHDTDDDWQLSNASSYKSIGVSGGLSGFGADLLILDDLIADAAEANSQATRDRIWDWIQSVALPRTRPESNIILIGTRWHQDDVTGRFLKQGGRWQHVNLPALSTGDGDPLGRPAGAALWPERFPGEWLAERQAETSRYFWNALYQGNPIAMTGNHLDIEKFQHVPAMPTDTEGMRFVRAWDTATSLRTAADWSVGALVATDRAGNFWICDVIRMRAQWPTVRERIIRQASIDRCQTAIESGGPQGGLVQNLKEEWPKEFPLTEHRPEADKLTRALPWFSRVNSGKAFLVQGGWNNAFLDECQSFPIGAHDDQIDGASLGYQALGNQKDPGKPLVIITERAERAMRLRERY